MKEADRMEVKEHASEFVRTLEEPILGQPKNSVFTNNMHNCFFYMSVFLSQSKFYAFGTPFIFVLFCLYFNTRYSFSP